MNVDRVDRFPLRFPGEAIKVDHPGENRILDGSLSNLALRATRTRQRMKMQSRHFGTPKATEYRRHIDRTGQRLY